MKEMASKIATFNIYSRDLFWSIFIDGKTISWSGYDDDYWWKNVSITNQFRMKEHNGKRYYLNPETNEVFLCLD